MVVHPRDIRRAVEANGAEATAQRAADEAEATLAQVIGQHVALNLAQVLPQMLAQLPHQPACVMCVARRKKAEEAAAPVLPGSDAEAAQAAAAALPGVSNAVTWLPLVTGPGQPPAVLPVCYPDFSMGPDVRPVGLVDPSGSPIMAHGGA